MPLRFVGTMPRTLEEHRNCFVTRSTGRSLKNTSSGASDICTDVMKFPVDLAQRVRREKEATLKEYHESIALIVTMELAQLEILETFFEISLTDANMMTVLALAN